MRNSSFPGKQKAFFEDNAENNQPPCKSAGRAPVPNMCSKRSMSLYQTLTCSVAWMQRLDTLARVYLEYGLIKVRTSVSHRVKGCNKLHPSSGQTDGRCDGLSRRWAVHLCESECGPRDFLKTVNSCRSPGMTCQPGTTSPCLLLEGLVKHLLTRCSGLSGNCGHLVAIY